MDDAIRLIFFDFNCCCSRNRDRDKCYACVVKGLIIYKGVVDSETRNYLIKVFYGQDYESILIDNSSFG